MAVGTVDVKSLSKEKYWALFSRMIDLMEIGIIATFTGWIFHWLDYVPDSLIRTGIIDFSLFLVAILAGLWAAGIMVYTGNQMGTGRDRALHILLVSYTIIGSLVGLIYHFKEGIPA
jgi:hypothetical protein